MEGVRALTVLAAEHDVDFDWRMEKLLEIGCAHFGLDLGMAARVIGDRYEVIAIHAPDDFPVARNRVFALDETYCRTTLESERPIAVDSVSKSNWTGKPTRDAFRFEGIPRRGHPRRRRVLRLAVLRESQSRERRFTATEKDLVTLMSQWLGSELERRLAPAPSACATRQGDGAGATPTRSRFDRRAWT